VAPFGACRELAGFRLELAIVVDLFRVADD
jgi:hypothetical protein